MTRERKNINELIRVIALTTAAAGVTGATIALSIRRKSNGQWWNGTAFQAGFTTVTMTEIDAVNWPGHYGYNFDTTGLGSDVYQFFATSADATIANDPWLGELKVGNIVESQGSYTLEEALSIILAAVAGRTADDGLTFKTADDAATRIAATVNASDERTAITLTPSS